MNPTDLAELQSRLEPCETSAAEAAEITRVLRRQEASLRVVEASHRKWSCLVWRLWPTFCKLLCAPWRLVAALRMPPDRC